MGMTHEQQQERKIQVARAAARVLAREGLSGTSMRAIADELGCTVGLLTYYFRSKDDMLMFVHWNVVGVLFGNALAAADGHSGLRRIEAILLNALPDTAERLERWTTWVELLGPTIRRGVLLPLEESENRRFLRELERELRSAHQDGLLHESIEPSREPWAIMSLVDGIAVDTVLQPSLYPPETQRWLARRYVDRLARDGAGWRSESIRDTSPPSGC